MKKALLGTTALVAGGLFAGAAVAADLIPAPAPEPVEEGFTLNITGFMTAFFLFRSDDESVTIDHNIDPTQISLSSEILFEAEQTLANGLTIKAHIEMEAQREMGNNIDEAWLSLAGQFGEIQIGGQDGALNQLQAGPPTAGIYGSADGPSFKAISYGSAPGGTFAGITSDDNKLIYFTPRMSGVKIGASFTPDTSGDGPAFNGGDAGIPSDSGSDYVNVWDIAANVEHNWGEHKLTVAGGYESGEEETGGSNGDLAIWNVGAVLSNSYGGIGFRYTAKDNKASGATVDDYTAWTVQGTIKGGDMTYGGGYFKGEANFTAGGTDELSRFYVGADYNMATGVKVGGFVAFENYDASAGSASDKDGVVGGLGMTVKF